LLYKYPVGRFVVPFTNVIANVANETINYSPIGFLRAAKGGSISGNRKEFSEQQKLDLQYKAAMGVMGAAVAMALASIDDDEEDPYFQITADGYNDFAKNKDLMETGWQPYSIKVGDKWISYKLTPLVFMLSGIGAFKDYQRYRKGKVDDGVMTRFGYAMRAALATVTESTFLPSLNQFLDSLLDRSGQGSLDGLVEWGTKTATTMVPVIGTNAFQQFSQAIQQGFDIEEKEYRGTIFGRMLRNVPVARNIYQNVVNGLGEEQPPDIDVIYSTERSGPNEKLWNLLSKNKTTTGIPTIKGVTVLNKEGEEVSVDNEQFYLFAKARGEYIADAMNSEYKNLSEMEPKEFAKAMSTIKGDGTAYAKAVVESKFYGKESEKLYLPQTQQLEAKLNPNKEAKKAFNEALESGNIERAKKAFNKIAEKMPEDRKTLELLDRYKEITNQNPIQKHADEVASVVYGRMDDVPIIQGDTITTVRKLYTESELAFFKKKMDDFSRKQAKKVEILDSLQKDNSFKEYFTPYNQKFGGALTEPPVVKKQPSLTERTMKNLKMLFK
jgi:hypothetical protein